MIRKLEAWLKPSVSIAALVDPVFRVATSLIFIFGGIVHFIWHDEMLARFAKSPWAPLMEAIGDPSLMSWMSGGIFVLFGVTLALGFATRLSAIALFATLVPITLVVHLAVGNTGEVLKNVAILGALLHFFANGPGRFAFDPPTRLKDR